ncbi:ABC transporter permease [Nocardioides sp. zg-1228]|uniref:ABC transporter permease n=1 Tax=Nocardioides sp. zg-1228 TaxID=2763008 RepID=UPI0016425B2D|nr:ABC transporter permease [Nocardioides sp. zg-1228]MBC2931439.1 ABC transporter permease [Nocardioides sp. zg-1228]QSF57052.1 ABC transporter permease [Nocardioides sp. zg-1228]
MSEPSGPGRSGVIHDLGYRHYEGVREGTPAIARTLFATGLRHAYGLGRSGKSKVMPFLLLAMSLLPATIVVGVVVLTGLGDLPVSYADYTNQTQLLVSLFAASQAPVLFSRDLRHRSIVLYLARPLPAAVFALVRWLSLTVAVLLFTAIPTVVLYAGAMLAGLDKSDQTTALLKALVLQVLLAMMIAGVSGLISSISLRRGFAVVGSVMALIVLTGIVTVMQNIAYYEGDSEAASVGVGLVSPWSLVNGLANAWDAGVETPVDVTGAWVPAYAIVAVLLVAACLLGLVARFRKVGSR